MIAGRRGVVVWLLAVAVSSSFACSSGPTEIILPPVETVIAGGDLQYGTIGQTLPTDLHVVVRALTTELPQEDVNILWTVERGAAEILGINYRSLRHRLQKYGLGDIGTGPTTVQ